MSVTCATFVISAPSLSPSRPRKKWPLYLKFKLRLCQDYPGTMTVYSVCSEPLWIKCMAQWNRYISREHYLPVS